MRSHIFQLLLGVLLFTVIALPYTISGDGTPAGFIKISLKYSLSIISFIILLSSVWLSAFTMGRDVETYQLHMVTAKPVSRVMIWFGKFSGVMLINTILLFVSAFTVYFIISWKAAREDFSEKDRTFLEEKVLVARKNYVSDQNELSEEAIEKEVQRRVKDMQKNEVKDISLDKLRMAELRRKVKETSKDSTITVVPGKSFEWTFSGLPTNLKKDDKIFLRFKIYLDSVKTEDQRRTICQVSLKRPNYDRFNPKVPKGNYVYQAQRPFKPMGSLLQEISVPSDIITEDGTATVSLKNLDSLTGKPLKEQKVFYFQRIDGPFIMIKEGSFFNNYMRSVIICFLMIFGLTLLSCVSGGIFSIPTAIFVVSAYIAVGLLANYFAADMFWADASNEETLLSIISRCFLALITPLSSFDFSEQLSKGELIEMSSILSIAFNFIVVRTMPLVALGIYVYRNRELGLIVRK